MAFHKWLINMGIIRLINMGIVGILVGGSIDIDYGKIMGNNG